MAQHYYRPANDAPNKGTPAWVNLAVDNTDTAALSHVVISFDEDGNPRSFLTSIEWNFTAYVQANSDSAKERAIWSYKQVPKVIRLEIQRLMYEAVFERRRSADEGLGGLAHLFSYWRILSKLLVEADMTRLADLNQQKNQRKLFAAIKEKRLSKSHVSHYLSALNAANRLGFTRFAIAKLDSKAKSLACESKQETKTTLALPHAIACAIYGTAMATVEQYHPIRHKLGAMFATYHLMLESGAKPIKVRDYLRGCCVPEVPIAKETSPSKYPNNNYNWNGMVEFYHRLLTDCGVSISSVTGLRVGEWYELDAGSFRRSKRLGLEFPLLVGYTTKLNNGRPMRKAWVTAPISEQAIELLEAITQPRREQLFAEAQRLREAGQRGKARKLFRHARSLFLAFDADAENVTVNSYTFKKDRDRPTQLVKLVKRSGKEAELTADLLKEYQTLNKQRPDDVQVGDAWPLASHQLRRTWVVMFLRNRFGSLVAAKEQLGHMMKAMTAIYGKNAHAAAQLDYLLDEELKQEINEMAVELWTEVACNIYLGDETLSGGKGDEIMAKREQGILIYEDREAIRRAIASGELAIVDNGVTLCLNPKCERLSCTINPEVGTVLCKSDIMTDEHARQRLAMRNRQIERYENTQAEGVYMPNTLSKIRMGIRACELILTKHDIPFEPYEAAPIKVTQL